MNTHNLDEKAIAAMDLLALARRGAAHDVNNLLAVIRGNMQLLTSLDTDLARSALREIDLGCERLALLCDSWLLADSAMSAIRTCARVNESIIDVLRVVAAAQDAELRVAEDPAAGTLTCGVDERTLRALMYCTLTSMLRAVHGVAIDIHLIARGTACTVHLTMVCPQQQQPRIVAPGTFGGSSSKQPESITTGLWDVAQCLERHGGGLRHAADGDIFQLWLDLPAHQV